MFNFATKDHDDLDTSVNDSTIGANIIGANGFAFVPFRSKEEYNSFFNQNFFGLGKYYGASGGNDHMYNQIRNQITSKFQKMIHTLLDQENNRIYALEVEYSRIGSPLATMKSDIQHRVRVLGNSHANIKE